MKTMTIGELKNKFSSVLEKVKQGETIVISYGRKKEKVAAIVPYEKLRSKKRRSLGLLSGQAGCVFKENFTLTDESFLQS